MEAIDALKQKVLSLAIQGKLVAQDPTDEPASVLLDKIKAEKAELVKQGKIKKAKQESYIYKGDDNKYYEKIGSETKDITDEIPFDIPENWELIRLPLICTLTKGKEVNNTNLPYLDVKYLRGKKEKEYISKGCVLNKNDFVILVDGENSGEVFKIPEEGIMGSTFRQLVINSNMYESYILHVLKYYQTLLRQNKRGAAIPHLDKEVFNNLLIGLPSLSEQKRIVEEIEKIFGQIEVVKENQEKLNKLKDGLKNKILDLAIQGKLVEQDPNDEPASVLLEKIKAEKTELVKQGKIKKNKQESYIYKGADNRHYEKIGTEVRDITDEIPFDIPNNWCWCRLGSIVNIKGGKRIPKGMSFSDEVTNHIYIRVTDMKNGTISSTNLKYIDEDVFNMIMNYTISKSDLYLTIAGSIGLAGIVPDEFDGMNLTENAVKLTDIKINKMFLHKVLQASFAQQQFATRYHQVAQPKLSIETANKTLIPIPPYKEQQKIIEKLSKLLDITDNL